MSDVYQCLQPSFYLPLNEYPPNRSYYGHFQHPPPYSQWSFLPPKWHLPPDVPHPHIFPAHPSSLRRRLSRPSSLRVQHHISNFNGRPSTLKKCPRTSTTQPPPFPVSGALSSIRLAGRPHDWRSGYKPLSKSYLRKHFESFVVPCKLTATRSCILTPFRLNPLLVAIQANPPNVSYDLRKSQTEDAILFPSLNRLPNAIDFYQLITSPPIHHITLWHQKLPWQINIEASQPNGITISDFFHQIYQQLHQSIAQEEYYTDQLRLRDREMLSMAFQTRCAIFPDHLPAGVRRIDFLGQEVCFIGLKRSRGGRWEFKTRSSPPKERMIID